MLKKEGLLNKEYLYRLLKLSIPIMLSNVVAELQMLIDRVFLGHVNNLYMTAISNVTSPMWATMSFCFSISVGASILISQAVGADDREQIESYAGSLLKWNNVISGILFLFWFFCSKLVFTCMGVSETVIPMCVSYAKFYSFIFLILGMGSSVTVILQTSNYTKPLIWYGLVRSGVNIVLDWILIFGHLGMPKLGIKGAAIATTISEYVGSIFVLFIIIRNSNLNTKPSLTQVVQGKFAPYMKSIKLGINTALEDFAWNIGNIVMISILNSINELAAGIYSIIFSVEVIAVVLIGAIGNGTMTLTGEATGKKDLKMFKGVCIYAYGACVLVAVVTLCICLIFPEQLISLFTSDQEIITSCGIYLILISINLYCKSANIIVGNGIRGSGNTKWMLFTQIFGTVFIIGVACLFVYVLKLGIAGVFLAVIVDEAVRAAINFGKYISVTKKWSAS